MFRCNLDVPLSCIYGFRLNETFSESCYSKPNDNYNHPHRATDTTRWPLLFLVRFCLTS